MAKLKSSMGDWRQKIRRKAQRGSQTPGRQKGLNCQATGPDRIMASRNRSYKYPGYEQWCKKKNGVNVK